ncbi:MULTISPECIES: DsbA family protein [Paracoccaceae]|jgi:protein-disulfide isomerase|uniref:DsbA family protein n=1 Tax=Szabonella alba TaxID=2804194 RepID=A0A8K0Y1U6_9RHOB|nr:MULTISPECIES: DsbA family protein [Paracoccaceae]MBJ2153407.1 DsbA family protein [Paracoccus sp. IB05]MBL4918573.1 DsbA family protein [Szabonella alba]
MRKLQRREFTTLGLVSGLTLSVGVPMARAQDNPMPPELRDAIERQPFSPVLGNSKGDVTLTEFFDYNCPHCRTSVPVIRKLIGDDPHLRVVLREWPVFGESSEFCARASLASVKQGKYWQFHSGLMAIRGRAEEASAMRVAQEVGLDLAKLRRDMRSADVEGHIAQSMALGDHMGLMGTPTFIAGNDALFGKKSGSELKQLVAQARKDLA